MSYDQLNPMPQKKSPVLKYLMIGCAGMILLAIAGIGTVGTMFYRGTKKVDPIAIAALENIRDGDARTLYDESDDGFKEGASYDETVAALDAIRERGGELLDWTRTGMNFNSENDQGTLATFTYKGTFEKAEGTITLVLKKQDGGDPPYRLYRFDVND
jgi:hypothetical protein